MSAELTPSEIVVELDKYIIGQNKAKKAIAVAIRNRWRRLQLDSQMQRDIVPKNIIMIGPTGVGKTEIARRIAQLINAPFVKVEATKYTEVGYHGRDVESMIRDLVKVSIDQVRKEFSTKFEEKAQKAAEERILNILLPPTETDPNDEELTNSIKEKFLTKLRNGEMDQKEIEINVESSGNPPVFAALNNSMEDMGIEFQDILSKFSPTQKQEKRVTVEDARKIFTKEAASSFVDEDAVVKEGISRVENSGIIFLDEIDKIAGGSGGSSNPDVSRGGVQRDLLPIVEGSAITTRQGIVNTDHILFIAAGAFHNTRPSDLMPELQGRFPIRVELENLSKEDYVKILNEPKNSLIKQYKALIGTEDIELNFTDEAINALADATCQLNEKLQNIGARRLHTVLEKILEEISFDAPNRKGEKITMSMDDVTKHLENIIGSEDLSKYIL